jgi:hypothetical protein
MQSPFVNVQSELAKLADRKIVTKMALQRSIKNGDVDAVTVLQKGLSDKEYQADKIGALRETYEKADRDELVLNKQLQNELDKHAPSKGKQLVKTNLNNMSYVEKKNLFEELQVDRQLNQLLSELDKDKQRDDTIDHLTLAEKKKVLNELPKISAKYQKYAATHKLTEVDVTKLVDDAVNKLIIALVPPIPLRPVKPAGPASSLPSAPATVFTTPTKPPAPLGPLTPAASSGPPESVFKQHQLDLWYPVIPFTSQQAAWDQMRIDHPDHKTRFKILQADVRDWFSARKARQGAAAAARPSSSSASSSVLSSAFGLAPQAQPDPQSGHGLKKSKKIPFGNYMIDAKKLKKNILSITYRSGLKVKGLPNVQISDNFKKVFTKQKVNSKKLSLTDGEKKYLQLLLNKSDAEISKSKNKVLNDGSVNEISLMKNRLNILMGEIDAGNDNPKIKDEIASIITNLVELGKISREQAKEFMKTFIADI